MRSMELQFRVSGFQFQRRDSAWFLLSEAASLAERNWKPDTENLETVYAYSIEIFRSNLKSLSILPVPSTTLQRGSSAIETGNPVSSRIRLSRFLSSAPPPVST